MLFSAILTQHHPVFTCPPPQFATDYMRNRKAAQQQARQEAAAGNPEAPNVELIEREKDAAAAAVDEVVVQMDGTEGNKEEKEEAQRGAQLQGVRGEGDQKCGSAAEPDPEMAAADVTVQEGVSEQDASKKKSIVVFRFEIPGIWGPWQPALLWPTAVAGAMAGFLAGLFGAVRRAHVDPCFLRAVHSTCLMHMHTLL